MTPFEEDCIVQAMAARGGFTIRRSRTKVKLDPAIMLPTRYYKLQIDYQKLRSELEAGAVIPGATLIEEPEYILSKETAP